MDDMDDFKPVMVCQEDIMCIKSCIDFLMKYAYAHDHEPLEILTFNNIIKQYYND